nr:hypothetical protein [uncultured Dysosmobacter sp.]
MDILILMLPILIIVAFYYAIYKAIKYIFSDLLNVYFSKKHQYEKPEDTSTETEFYKTAADIESHLKNEQTPTQKASTKKPFTQADFERWKQDKGGFIDLDAPIILPWQRTA